MTDKNILKNWFENGKKPTQEQFWAWMDSYFHKSELFQISNVEDLERILNEKAEQDALEALASLLDEKVDKKEGYQLSEEDFTTFLKEKLEGLQDYSETIENIEERIVGVLRAPNNLDDVDDVEEARVNLGLGTASTYNVGKEPDQVPTNADIEAEFDVEAWMNSLPRDDSFGDFPELIVRNGDTTKMVKVSPEGIFTDIRVFTTFVGGAIEGGTNILRATLRNVSTVSVETLELDMVLPYKDDLIVYGEPVISKPSNSTVTLKSQSDNIYNYDIVSLLAGQTIVVSIPIAWNTFGTFQASSLVKITDETVIDYATSDDYSASSYRVDAKSEGEETIDCPLVEVFANGHQLPVYSIKGNTAIGNRIQAVSSEDIILEFSVPVTLEAYVELGASINSSNNKLVELNGNIIRLYSGNLPNNSSSSIGATLTQEGDKIRVSFDNNINTNGALLGIKAGLNCNTQYIYLNNKYKKDEGLTIKGSEISVVGIVDFILESTYIGNPTLHNFLDLDNGKLENDVAFHTLNTIKQDAITLNIPVGVPHTIKLTTSDKVALMATSLGNIQSTFDKATGVTTIKTNELTTIADSHTNNRVTFNFIQK